MGEREKRFEKETGEQGTPSVFEQRSQPFCGGHVG